LGAPSGTMTRTGLGAWTKDGAPSEPEEGGLAGAKAGAGSGATGDTGAVTGVDTGVGGT
jgi:hypothetical protein